MEISPRYEGPPLLHLDGATGDPALPLLQQRRRLGALLATLDDEQWAAPSRCDGWSVQDVVVHLNSTNQFFAISISSGLAGSPTRFLAGFDPVASPAQLVDDRRGSAPAEVLETYHATVQSLADAVTGLDAEAWGVIAEAPPGHIAARGVALHALWDAWVHERDIVLPLGLPPVEEDDEVLASLRYAVALGPVFLATRGDERRGTAVFEATDPSAALVVEIGPTVVVRDLGDSVVPDGAARVSGRAVHLLEALSYRAPLEAAVPDEHTWMFEGLAEVFDLA